MFERRLLTNKVLDALKDTGIVVGDAYAPDEPFGWSNTPESPGSSFIPYIVSVPGAISDLSGSLGRPDADMWIPYQVTGYGSTRDQCEWVMDNSRDLIKAITGDSLSTTPAWKIVYVDTKLIGGILRGGPEDTPVFGETDTFIIFLSEEMS